MVKPQKSRLTLLIIAGIGIGIILVAMWSNHLSRPTQPNQPQPSPAVRAEPGGSSTVTNPNPGPPDVNPAALKDRGDLAFVWRGLLYTLEGGTGEVRRLTDSGRALYPAWSHDGQWLAFIRAADSQSPSGQLWLVRRDGSQARQVEGVPELSGPGQFSWSPSANVLAVGGQNGPRLVPAEVRPSRRGPPVISVADPITSFAWSPDGKYLAYNITLPSDQPAGRSDELYIMNLESGRKVRHISAPGAGIRVIAWWLDGRGLLYRLVPSYSASLAADGLSLWSLRLGDSEAKLLTDGLGHREWTSISPRGSLLTVASGGRAVWTGKSLAVINLESGSVRELKNPEGSVALDPALSPDGSRMAFVTARDLGRDVWGFTKDQLADWVATRGLWVGNADGSGARPLISAGTGVYQPAWSKDGARIMYVRDNTIWTIGAGGGKPERVLGPFPEQKELFGFYGFVSYQDVMAWFQP